MTTNFSVECPNGHGRFTGHLAEDAGDNYECPECYALMTELKEQVKSNKQLIAQIREGVEGLMVPVRLDAGLTSDYVITASITINKVLALLEKIEKELK